MANAFRVVLFKKKKENVDYICENASWSVFLRFAQVRQQCVCLHILFPKRFPSLFIYIYIARYLKGEIVQSLLMY